MQNHRKYIKRGAVQPIETVPSHHKAPIRRLLMLNKDLVRESKIHVAVHFIQNLPKKVPPYGDPHRHDYDEINLVLSTNGKLVYRVQLDEEVFRVTSPSTVYIPKGLRHCANVISGTGLFVVIAMTPNK
jgi:mannose-6-phosphate isomerase-like protein (cupin superfamily)